MKVKLNNKIVNPYSAVKLIHVHPSYKKTERAWTNNGLLYGYVQLADGTYAYVNMENGREEKFKWVGHDNNILVTSSMDVLYPVDRSNYRYLLRGDSYVGWLDSAKSVAAVDRVNEIVYVIGSDKRVMRIICGRFTFREYMKYTNIVITASYVCEIYPDGVWIYGNSGEQWYTNQSEIYRMLDTSRIFQYGSDLYHYTITLLEETVQITVINVLSYEQAYEISISIDSKFAAELDMCHINQQILYLRTTDDDYIRVDMYTIMNNLDMYRVVDDGILDEFLPKDIMNIVYDYLFL